MEEEHSTLPPDSNDVIAACAFMETLSKLPVGIEMQVDVANTARRIFDAWVATLDLGDES